MNMQEQFNLLQGHLDALHAVCGAETDEEKHVQHARHLVERLRESIMGGRHQDDVCVHQFAELMRIKLRKSRAKGRRGWQDCSPDNLRSMMREHLDKGDPVDVANFCMFLSHLNQPTSPDPRLAEILRLERDRQRMDWICQNISHGEVKRLGISGHIRAMIDERIAVQEVERTAAKWGHE